MGVIFPQSRALRLFQAAGALSEPCVTWLNIQRFPAASRASLQLSRFCAKHLFLIEKMPLNVYDYKAIENWRSRENCPYFLVPWTLSNVNGSYVNIKEMQGQQDCTLSGFQRAAWAARHITSSLSSIRGYFRAEYIYHVAVHLHQLSPKLFYYYDLKIIFAIKNNCLSLKNDSCNVIGFFFSRFLCCDEKSIFSANFIFLQRQKCSMMQ